MRRIFPGLAVIGCLALGLPTTSVAQTNPGFAFNWSGDLPRSRQLSYRLDSGNPNRWDRYYLKLRPQKLAISKISISYPDYYRGKLDPEAMDLRVDGKNVALTKVNWDKTNHLIELTPVEAIPADTPVEVVLSNVKNPTSGGMYFFNARISSPGGLPLPQYAGTWVISISKS